MTNATNATERLYADVNISAMTDIHAIREPHAAPWLWVALAVTTLVLAALAWWIVSRRKTSAETEALGPQETPSERVRRELDALEARLAAEGPTTGFFTELSLSLRRYIEARFAVRAQEMTSEEFVAYIKDSDLLVGRHKNLLREFFSATDLIKFAKQVAGADDARSSLASVRSFAEETAPCEDTKESDGR